jgi:Tfp pilus assembly protein PilF
MSSAQAAAIIAACCVAHSGCSGLKDRLQPNVAAQRQQRAAEAVQAFEGRRDKVQLEAALDRFQQGNVDAAQAMLTGLVTRRPDYSDARLRLAEVLWSRGDAAAEAHLRAVLEKEPSRPEAHHALGLVLDGTGRSHEAQQHFLRAAELEPENEVYRLTFESLASG